MILSVVGSAEREDPPAVLVSDFVRVVKQAVEVGAEVIELNLSQDFRFGSSDGTSLHPHPAKRNHFSTRKRRRLRRDRSSPLLAPHGG